MFATQLELAELKGFPEHIEENGKIKTSEFIDASNEIVSVLEKFGKLFTPIVMDMRGNTSQLYDLYQKDVKNWEYIEDMILTAPELKYRAWLLWLKRALELIERFFYYVMTDPDIIAQKSDSLQPMIVRAYNEVLKPYHGFLLQQTFSMLNRWIPNRKTLLGVDEHFEDNIKHLNILMPKMRKHIDKVDTFLKQNGFDDRSKV
ncbi:uncharacterized protein [Chironomus tepperi]|uniref:uncharacterized protein isoform X2 n=1 Tax=Chironomus tepperi TaxID=113505 RepID=UPI00391F2A83